jgi:hypothetical protein
MYLLASITKLASYSVLLILYLYWLFHIMDCTGFMEIKMMMMMMTAAVLAGSVVLVYTTKQLLLFRRFLRLALLRWRYSIPPPHGKAQMSKSELTYGRRSVGLSILVLGHHLGPETNFSSLPMEFFLKQLRFFPLIWGARLTRGRVSFFQSETAVVSPLLVRTWVFGFVCLTYIVIYIYSYSELQLALFLVHRVLSPWWRRR